MIRTPTRTAPIALAVAGLLIAAPAAAAPELTGWDYGGLYDDWRVSTILGGNALTIGGEDVGDVHDLSIGEDGVIQSMIVETDANLTPRGRYFEVPFRDVDVDPETFSVTLIQDLEAARALETSETPPRLDAGQWKASMLIGMPAELNGEPWGRVDDLIFDGASRSLTAYAVEPLLGDAAVVALPFDATLVVPDPAALEIPWGPETVGDLDMFDYGMM